METLLHTLYIQYPDGKVEFYSTLSEEWTDSAFGGIIGSLDAYTKLFKKIMELK